MGGDALVFVEDLDSPGRDLTQSAFFRSWCGTE